MSIPIRLPRRTVTGPALVAVLALLAAAPLQAKDKSADVTAAAIQKAAAPVQKALVRIHVVSPEYNDGRELKRESAGSGVIISPEGYAVTNHHVAGHATRMWVTMPNREELEADLVGSDAMADIAVIKIKPDTPRKFDYAEWGDSDKVKTGDPVLALGSPLALAQSVTKGIISNNQMGLSTAFGNESWMRLDGEDVGSIVLWFGHDAQIQHGNSGGPLVDMNGHVIGINELSYGLSGAIPGNLAKEVAGILREKGEVVRAWAGVVVQPLPKSEKDRQGVLVSSVIRDSPAEKAGIKAGDIMVSLEGEPVSAHFNEEIPPLNLRMANLPIGKPADLQVERDGTKLDLKITPEKREKVLTPESELRQWGITGRNLSIWAMIDMNRKSRDGVLVTSTNSGGPAGTAKPEIRGGDVITRVGDITVKNLDELKAATEKVTAGHDSPVPTVVAFDRDNQSYLTSIEIGIKDLEDPGAEVAKAWVPVDTQVLTRELAKGLGIADKKGVRVVQVYGTDKKEKDASPLKVGDILTKVDDEPIEAAEMHDSEVFSTMIRQYKIGTEVEFTVLRDGKEEKVKMKLPAKPKQPREMKRFRSLDFQFTVRELAYLDQQKNSWTPDGDPRILVESVVEGGWTALARLQVGDYLLSIDGKPIATLKDVENALKDVTKEQKRFVTFKVRRRLQTAFLEVEPLWEKKTDEKREAKK